MEPLFGILFMTLSALTMANWPPPAELMSMPSASMRSIMQPPTKFFRELLAANPQERLQRLNRYAPRERELLLSKVRTYEAMNPEVRDRELRRLDLRLYFDLLIRQPLTNRSGQLQRIPEGDRNLVEQRVKRWDRISPELQKSILEHETAIRLQFCQPSLSDTLHKLSPARRHALQQDIAEWKALPAEDQQQIFWSYRAVFEIDEPPLPSPATLEVVESTNQVSRIREQLSELPADERRDLLENFEKLSRLPLAQQHRIVRTARFFQGMSARQQEYWRHRFGDPAQHSSPQVPPMPPGFESMFPPSPPGLTSPASPRIPRSPRRADR